ncbi:MAG: T9SS type A sorting domain-containing protein [Bacteroidetes bacterium]|nr:T9SS type A sorting domain-containing protein [Bacteroidota bacterium]
MTNYTRVNAIAIAGIQRMAIYNTALIVTKGSGASSDFVEVYSMFNLSFVKAFSSVSDESKDILIVGDTAYVSVPGNWMATTGQLAIIDLNTMSYVREEALGTNAVGIGRLIYGSGINGKIYTINSIGWGQNGTIGQFDITKGKMDTIVAYGTSIGGGAIVLNGSGLLFANVGGDFGSINLSDLTINDSSLIAESFATVQMDTIFGTIYGTTTDYFSYGKVIIYNVIGGVPVDSFDVGVSPEGLGLIWKFIVGVDESADKQFGIYPNPAKDFVRVRSDISKGIYSVVDITGRMVMSGKTTRPDFRLDVANLKKGIYFISVSDRDIRLTKRLIKQ